MHREKLAEAKYNLGTVKESFEKNDGNFEHCLNNFLSSAQSILWALNKSFSKKQGYEKWILKRGERLPVTSKHFKELRNITVKEGPVRSESIKIGFNFGPEGIPIPARATFTSPVIDTWTNKIIGKGIIETAEGEKLEVNPAQIIHDFSVKVESAGKMYAIDSFIKDATDYLLALEKEIEETEELFR